ncbi:MAG: hypothetical protein JSW64_00715 [Candidatus Zixiibacteriota bacterium]|nr:MAG: hypothetical protein JSW64_00715 [candidate division Zixibacteria bacterium]
MRKALSVLVLAAVLLFFGNAMAQEQAKTTRAGIGFHLGWPTALGPSLKVWFTPMIGIQGMGSRWSSGDWSLTMLSGRLLLKLTKTEGRIFPYLGAGGGAWIAKGKDEEWDPYVGWTEKDVTETVNTFEALLGMQHKYAENFYGDYELGYYVISDFEEADVSISGMAFSYALHYFF